MNRDAETVTRRGGGRIDLALAPDFAGRERCEVWDRGAVYPRVLGVSAVGPYRSIGSVLASNALAYNVLTV